MKRFALSAFVVALCAVTSPAAAQAPAGDPMAGVWTMNIAKSTFSPGPAPRSSMWRYENRADGTTIWTAVGVNAAGLPTFSFSVRRYDGRAYPVFDGNNLPAFIANGTRPSRIQTSRLVDARTTEVRNVEGTAVSTVTRTMSADGKTFTARTVGTNAAGQPINDVTVWEKQENVTQTSQAAAGVR